MIHSWSSLYKAVGISKVGPVTHPEQLNFPLRQTSQVLDELLWVCLDLKLKGA